MLFRSVSQSRYNYNNNNTNNNNNNYYNTNMSCSKPIAVVHPFSPNQEEAKEAVNLIKIASTEMTEYITTKLGRGTRYVTISSIVAAIMGTMSAIRASMKVGFKESFLHYASILTQLNSFVASMALLFKEEGIPFSKKRAWRL